MKLDRDKVDIAMARKKMTTKQLADVYGVSRARMNVILNSQVVTPACAGRVAEALEVDVTEILAD
jgi:DNA-binding Xre family transcriptional regulator